MSADQSNIPPGCLPFDLKKALAGAELLRQIAALVGYNPNPQPK